MSRKRWTVMARRYPASPPVRCKQHGEPIGFSTKEEADVYAAKCRETMRNLPGNPHYYAEELTEEDGDFQ